jgi:cysteine-rich repeat protein
MKNKANMSIKRHTGTLLLCTLLGPLACSAGPGDGSSAFGADSDATGIESVAQPLVRALPARIEAEAFERFADSNAVHEGNCGSGAVDLETTTDPNGGTCHVGWTIAGEYLEYDLSSASARTYNLTLRVASANAGKTVRVQLDGVTLGTVTAPNAGWQSFADRTLSAVNVAAGNHVLRVTFVTGEVNLNYIDISAANGATCASVPLARTSASASSTETTALVAANAIDGNAATRWSSSFADNQWLQVDLGTSRYIDRVSLAWEGASAADYRIELSADANNWTTVKSFTGGSGARTDSLTGLTAHVGRYVRMYGTRRSTAWGYSLWEMQVFGDNSPVCGAASVCGNGTLEGSEQCDDGNSVSNDGCSSTCTTDTNEFKTGLWRLASRTDRSTLSRSAATGTLTGNDYTGNVRQQWRLRNLSGTRYEFKLELNNQCLVASGSNAVLGACGNSAQYWTLETLRARTEAQPALYRLRSPSNTCLVPNGSAAPTLAACNDAARWYLEPVGYGERTAPRQYELRTLLIVKPTVNVASPFSQGTIASDIVAAAQVSFKRDVATWFQRMTDGRVLWTGESVVSPTPLTTLFESGGNWLPAAVTMQDDVQAFVPRGKYDSVAAFFKETLPTAPGGWGWGPGVSQASNYTAWVTVKGGDEPAANWISGDNEPTEVFIHEPMHGLDGYFEQLGLPLPVGYLHGTEFNAYDRESNGWMPWYRDYWLGTIIAADDTYRGYGPRAFRLPTVRQAALSR